MRPFELQGGSLATFLFDLRMNQLGIPVNVPALRNAQKIVEAVQSEVVTEFRQITQLNPTQRDKVMELVKSLGVPIDNMQADTLSALDLTKLNPKAARIIELYSKLSFAAIKKIASMLEWTCPDDRMRGVLIYHGAGTGRWTARGPQIQNAKKTAAEMRPVTQEAYVSIQKGATAGTLEILYGEPFEVLSSCIRYFIQSPGFMMLDGDYNAIEARIACWLSGQTDAVAEYRQGVDRYKLMAAEIYEKLVSQVTPDEREVGKRAILGLGYGMGEDKFKFSCMEQYGIDMSLDLAKRAKKAFRKKHSKMTAYWYFLDDQCREAIEFPNRQCGPFLVRTISGILYLLARLPSGRQLAYPHPQIIKRKATDAEKIKFAKEEWSEERVVKFLSEISYWGQLPMSTRWDRIKLYGAKIFENMCQGIAADIMAHGAITAESRGFEVFALIHDQGLSLNPRNQSPEDYSAALADTPSWARGLSLKVESKTCKYYSK